MISVDRLRNKLKNLWTRMQNKAPDPSSGKVRLGGVDKQNWVIMDPFWPTEDEYQLRSKEPEAVNDYASLGDMIDMYQEIAGQAAQVIARNADPDIWEETFAKATPLEVVYESAGKGGVKDLPRTERLTANDYWKERGDELLPGEVPIAIPVEGYADLSDRLSAWTGEGSRPLVVVTDDKETRQAIARSFVVAMAMQPSGFGFAFTTMDIRTNNQSNFSVVRSDTEWKHYLSGAVAGAKGWREQNMILLDNLGESKSGWTDLAHLLLTTKWSDQNKSNRVGMLATMTSNTYLQWVAGDRNQRIFLNQAGIVFDTFLDSDTPTLLARKLAPENGVRPELIAENLLRIKPRQLGCFKDRWDLQRFWTLG